MNKRLRRFLLRLRRRNQKSAQKRTVLTNRQVLLIATAFCFLLIAVSFFDSSKVAPLRAIANYTVVPMEKGINRIGFWLSNQTDHFRSLKDVQNENKALKDQVDSLTEKNTALTQSSYELNRLQQLYQLDQAYGDYPKTGARIIGKDTGNWFHLFTIDKGEKDGITKDMNVIADGGLVGIVTQTGPNWATVRSIIDDNCTVSALSQATSDLCFVSGSLAQYHEGTLPFSDMANNKNEVKVGDTLVTSYISDKYLPGLTIGYISEIRVDTNNLTRSGYLTPAVDFQHLQEVLVITQTKQDYNQAASDAEAKSADASGKEGAE